ncbi:tail tape-measure protein [Erythrobacter phage vB_EliS_R6L]|nr:tail tape-measure protein [Erythrobacter phage vB_EliS_R6L]
MAEYRIVAKVDPQTAAGTNKVKADLRGVQQEARATETALNRSFDQQKFERTIGGLVSRVEQLDSSIKGLAGSNSTLAKSNETLGQTLDRVAASQGKANTQTQQGGRAAGEAAGKNSQLEAALMRVLRATDQEAAEQARLNALLADAKRLLDAGAISQERYAQVQQMAANVGREQVQVTGAQRIGMQQLGFQLGDVATMYSLGAKPAQIFASQIGQISQALMLMGGNNGSMLSRVAGFLAGPWGIALTVGTILLAPFVSKLFEGNDALGEAVEKLKADARETELAARAKEAYQRTLEGVTAAIREQNKELKENLQTQRDTLLEGMNMARQRLSIVQSERDSARRALEDAEALYEIQKRRASGPGQGSEIAALGLSDALERVEEARRRYESFDSTVREATEAIRRADAAFAQNAAERAVDPIKRLNDEYDRLRNQMIETAVASENFSGAALARELTQLENRRKAALEAAQAQDRLNRSTAEGVAVFRSREQAIGIAGRELQRSGLRVGENSQFGGVRGNHPGMGNSAHGRYAIDVNEGTGIVEADVPDLKAKFDAAARRYQSRGYRVLWNGWVYEANGNGPTRRIPGGQNQHRDHMHLEAPATIVGKATNASSEAQYQREDAEAARAAEAERRQAAQLEERAGDFVASVVSKAASRGLPNNRQSQLQADIDEAFADFERRFNRAASFTEKWEIATALTDADARETARAFEEAYVAPVERLSALQGKTGIERDILNAKLEETLRLGRELTPVEAQMIENGIRQNDQLSRQANILQQIREPLETYRATIEALNGLLADGTITQTSYNARLADLAQSAAGTFRGLPGVDPNSGQTYEDLGATADENARYAQQLEDFANHREQLLQMGVDYDALEEAAHQEHVNRLAQIDQARKDVQLAAAEDIMGSLVSIAENSAGKQSAIYKALFATEKAVAIARSVVAIQTGIAQASALPFPANLAAMATVAAQTASIVANIRAVTLAFKDGGYVSGPGGPRSDSIPARLSDGEFVVNARATASNRPLLEAINNGQEVRAATAATAAATTEAATGRQVAMVGGQPVTLNLRNVNVLDPAIVGDYLQTAEGEELWTNMMHRNADTVRQIVQQG